MKRGCVKIVVDLLHDRVVNGYSKKFTVWKDHQTVKQQTVVWFTQSATANYG